MSSFHITKRGEAALCNATERPCPLGGEHYPTAREAAVAAARSHGEAITFGKYEGRPLDDLLTDRAYCRWLVQQKWFKRDHPRVHRAIRRAQQIDRLRDDFNRI